MKFVILLALATIAFAHQNNNNAGGETKDMCYYCKANVPVLLGMVNSTEKQTLILEGVKGFCQVLQPPLKEKCSDFIKYVVSLVGSEELLWDVVVEELKKPAETCQLAGLCEQGPDRPMAVEEIVAKYLAKIPKGNTKEKVRSKLLTACSVLPPSQHFFCRSLIKSSMNQDGGMSSEEQENGIVGGIFGLMSCGQCEDLVKLTHASFNNSETTESIKFSVLTLCKMMGDESVQQLCGRFTLSHFDLFWSILVAELKHENIVCPVLGCMDVSTTTSPTTTTATTRDATTRDETTLKATIAEGTAGVADDVVP